MSTTTHTSARRSEFVNQCINGSFNDVYWSRYLFDTTKVVEDVKLFLIIHECCHKMIRSKVNHCTQLVSVGNRTNKEMLIRLMEWENSNTPDITSNDDTFKISHAWTVSCVSTIWFFFIVSDIHDENLWTPSFELCWRRDRLFIA